MRFDLVTCLGNLPTTPSPRLAWRGESGARFPSRVDNPPTLMSDQN